jgi:hypothetical protein
MSSSEDEMLDPQSSADEATDVMPAEPQDKDDEELALERLVFGAPAEFADQVARFSESDRRKRIGLDDGEAGAEGDAGLEDIADDDVRILLFFVGAHECACR